MLPVALNAPTFWIIASLLLGILLLPIRRNVEQTRFELFELVRWVAFPYLALLVGHLSPRLMGLTDQSWQTTFGIGLGVCFGLLGLVSLARVTNSKSSVERNSAEQLPQSENAYFEQNFGRPETVSINPGHWLWIAIHALGHEFHWSFLRAGIWETLLQLETVLEIPAYTALWSAGAIAFIEIVIHRRGLPSRGQAPQLHASHLRTPSAQTQWIWRLTTLLLTSILFFYTRNFYLCALLHVGMALMMPHTPSLGAKASDEARDNLRIETLRQSSQQISGSTQ